MRNSATSEEAVATGACLSGSSENISCKAPYSEGGGGSSTLLQKALLLDLGDSSSEEDELLLQSRCLQSRRVPGEQAAQGGEDGLPSDLAKAALAESDDDEEPWLRLVARWLPRLTDGLKRASRQGESPMRLSAQRTSQANGGGG